MSNTYQHLLAPGRIGKLELRNRIIVTAMGANLAESDGTCGVRIRAYHEEQAKGGVGLVNTGVAGVAWPVGANQPGQVAISDDRFIPGLTALADAVHKHGAKFSVQLHHGGLVGMEDLLAGRPVWGPSYPAAPKGDFTAAFLLEELEQAPFRRIKNPSIKVMTVEDIQTVVAQFAAAAVRAIKAGVDGVEIHGGHGYLLSSFISPKSNSRDDRYGGSLENRARFLLEVIRAVRAAVGPDFPVWCKLDAYEVGVDGGINLDDAKRTAVWVQEAGADAITVTAYHDSSQGKLHSGSHTPHEPAVNLSAAAAIKKVLSIPVIASGRVEPEVGDAHIAAQSIDFLAMGRKLLADPQLPNKLKAGRAQDILPCIYCYTCISAIYTCEPVRCAVNPRTGLEYIASDFIASDARKRIAQRERIVVIGGGPAGMEAARRFNLAGYAVTLFEKGARLGGTLQFAALAYEPNERLLNWLRRQIAATSVDVQLNTVATLELLQSLQPAAVIVATGAVRGMPSIPGNDLSHVFSGDDMRRLMLGESTDNLRKKVGWLTDATLKFSAVLGVSANLDWVRRATHYWMPLGKRIVIIGGELVGLELAEFLSERGRNVSVVDEAPRFGAGLTIVRRMRLLDELIEHGVGLFAAAANIRIERDAVSFTDSKGAAKTIEADQVIVAKGASGDTRFAEQLRVAGFNVHTIGDCRGVTYIEGAMRSAAEAVDTVTARRAAST
jgi:2,4-dienoyl-CoA reductase-like NADH-dependent reductase (Old Yellow Enzyme family)/NADPH-dependent 2,4-dienoyl-CoA reductase/sulfur reductase-like enzyme